uniref:kinesin-like protein KIN-10C n=1 Tax=Erigeron canadensis TaxID=72917 RepID=UPI001CB89B7E|nr:kinesin-like protein KIN-10C [Erigeron canadensis]
MDSSSKTQIKQCLNVSGKVRVVARIRGFSNQELASDATHSSCIISVRKSKASEKVTLSFNDHISCRKNEYEVDQCYGQNEDTALIYLKEVKPQISKVFDGEHSTFIAFGARGSGKTHTVQGSEENMGLGMLVMDEILKIVEGGRHTVAVSIYEVFQNHVYDLLDSKNPEVHILEDAQGKIMLKGLSKVPVKSMLEFQKLYCNGMILNKPTQKLTLELPRRSHKALTIHILAYDEGTNPICAGKMNFVDLIGYENPRRNSIDGTNFVQDSQINKSLNAFLNVIYAINANESRVPYRESKLARVLQDSFGGNNLISILVFLNPLYCPDTIHAVTLASRLKDIKPMLAFSSAKKHSHSRVPASANKANSVFSSAKKHSHSHVPASANKANSGVGVSSTTKKLTNSRLPLSTKKTNVLLKGRNLFGGTKQANAFKEQVSNMANNPSNIVKPDTLSGDLACVPYVKEENCISDGALFSSNVEDVPLAALTRSPEEDASVNTQSNCTECIPHINGDNVEKENNSNLSNEGQAPLSFGLEKILNRLLSIDAKYHVQDVDPPTPLCVNRPTSPSKDLQQESNEHVLLHPLKEVDTLEPKTPIATHKMDLSNCQSGTFSKCSSRMKQTLVQDYLQFLNSASKDELKGIRGIGEKRATYILELREESPEPFKSLDDLQEIGLSAKQVKSMMKNVAGDIFR